MPLLCWVFYEKEGDQMTKFKFGDKVTWRPKEKDRRMCGYQYKYNAIFIRTIDDFTSEIFARSHNFIPEELTVCTLQLRRGWKK